MIEVRPRWDVSIPTVVETRIVLAAPPGGPWALSRVLSELAHHGLRPRERFRSLGSGRGVPLVHSQEVSWRGLDAELEAISSRDRSQPVEVSLTLPPHRTIVEAEDVSEADLWGLMDAMAAAVDARHGALVDGEPLDLRLPEGARAWDERFRRHLGLLVPDAVAELWRPARFPYRALERSRLLLVLR